MTVLIKDDEADEMIRELADRTGQTMTDAVKRAVRNELQRLPLSAKQVADRKRKLDALRARAAKIPIVDNRTPDEIIGYNERGHFD